MLDTNILLDWLLDRDMIRTEQVDKLIAAHKELHVPDVVIVELAFALEKFYGLPRPLVANNLHKVIDQPNINCNKVMFRRAVAEYISHPAWSFLDSCILQYAELQGVLPVYSYDKKLVSQSSGRAKLPAKL